MKTNENVISFSRARRNRMFKNNRRYLMFCGIAIWLGVHGFLYVNYFMNGDHHKIYGVVEAKSGWPQDDDLLGD